MLCNYHSEQKLTFLTTLKLLILKNKFAKSWYTTC